MSTLKSKNILFICFLTAFCFVLGSHNILAFGGPPALPPLINEIVVNPNSGDDNCEYIEILGTSNASLNNFYFASVEGDAGSNEGTFDFVSDLTVEAFGSNGLLVITAMDTTGVCGTRTYNSPTATLVRDADLNGGRLENGTNSWLLILSPTTPIVEGTDYDTDDDGSLEALPADALIFDSLSWSDGGSGDLVYGGAQLPSTAGGTPDAATRFPGDSDSNSAAAWYHGDMDGAANSNIYDLTQVGGNFPVRGTLTPGNTNGPFPKDADFDGDGITDYGIVRDASAPLRGGASNRETEWGAAKPEQVSRLERHPGGNDLTGVPAPGNGQEWWIRESGSGSTSVTGFGAFVTNSYFTPADFDGDGKSDIAIWRGFGISGPEAGFFFIVRSSDGTIVSYDLGINADDARVVGDYDGDGKADPAVFRCPVTLGQCTFFYRGSAGSGEITFIPWGDNSTEFLRVCPGDYDGDGKYDVCIYRTNPAIAGQGQFVLLRSLDGGVEFVNWGLNNDVSLGPGDYDGDGRTDFMNVRSPLGIDQFWWLMDRTGNSTVTQWGALIAGFSEFRVTGDFDGDGMTDIGVWRRNNSNPDDCYFYVLRSSDGALEALEWGSPGDAPMNGWKNS